MIGSRIFSRHLFGFAGGLISTIGARAARIGPPAMFAIIWAAGATRGATLGADRSWPALYDTTTGSMAVSTLPSQCYYRADPVIASSGPQLEVATNANYALWPASGQSDVTYPERLADVYDGVIPSSNGFIIQPQVLYDQIGGPDRAGRFVMVATVYDNVAQRSWLAIATSAINSVPAATDCDIAVDANLQPDGSSTNFWAGSPRIGMTADTVYIAADMYAFDTNGSFQYAKLWALPKQNIYNVPFQQCPSGAGSVQIYSALTNADGSLAGDVVPAKSYDPGSSVTYLLSAHYNGDNALNLWAVDSRQLSLSAARTVPVKPYSPAPSAPQKSTTAVPSPPNITTLDARLVNAVYQPNSGLWTVHTTACPDNTALSCFKWYEIDPVAGTTSQDAFFGYTVDSVFAPAIAVSRNAAVFVFNASSANHFVDVNYVGRYAGDPANTLGTSFWLQRGVDVYIRGTPAFYSGADTDPTDDNRFWIAGAWASGNAGDRNATCGDGTVNHDWVTQVATVSFKLPPPPPPATANRLRGSVRHGKTR
jgi:hypothetical protein